MADELFRTAPKAVVDYFDRRPSKPTFNWRDVPPHEHALAWTAAKTAGFDIIEDLRDFARKAAVDRVPFDKAAADVIPVLKEKGWWGSKIATDPKTGEKVRVELGSLRRLRTIYWANVASAEAAGEWQRTQENKAFLPYLLYKLSVSERKRPQHRGWVGTTLPVDDPWWRTHYPPNGWNCKCRVEQISGPRAERQPPEKRVRPKGAVEIYRNRRTGRSERVPAGIDPGWQTNPGLTRERVAASRLRERMAAVPAGFALVAATLRSAAFRDLIERAAGFDMRRRQQPDMRQIGRLAMPVGYLPESTAAAIAEALGREPFRARTVEISAATAAKQIVSRKKRPLTTADYGRVQIIVEAPEQINATGPAHVDLIRQIDGVYWIMGLDLFDERDVLDLRLLFDTDPEFAATFFARTRRRDTEK